MRGAPSPSPPSAERVVVHAAPGGRPSDEELVLRALEGSAWAEAALCRAHAAPLLGMLTRVLGNRADADDLAQDAMVVALETLPKLREPALFRAWLFRIATNLARKRLRRRRFERMLGLAPAPDDGELDVLSSTAASPDTRAELALVERRLAGLSTELRLAWSLRFIEGYELTEVADLCGCSLATIKRRLAEAAKKIDVDVSLERKDS